MEKLYWEETSNACCCSQTTITLAYKMLLALAAQPPPASPKRKDFLLLPTALDGKKKIPGYRIRQPFHAGKFIATTLLPKWKGRRRKGSGVIVSNALKL